MKDFVLFINHTPSADIKSLLKGLGLVMKLEQYNAVESNWILLEKIITHESCRIVAMYINHGATAEIMKYNLIDDIRDTLQKKEHVILLDRDEHLYGKLNYIFCQDREEKNRALSNYIEELDLGTVMKLFIPKGRLHEETTDKFIFLLQNYGRNVKNIPISIHSIPSKKGVLYIFKVNTVSEIINIPSLVGELSSFLEVCNSDPQKAKEIINNANAGDIDTENIVMKYSIEAKRILLDIQHEKEFKMLSVRQMLEKELEEVNIGEATSAYLNKQINNDSVVIELSNPVSSGVFEGENLSSEENMQIAAAKRIIENDVKGLSALSSDERIVLKVLENAATGEERTNLRTAIFVINDNSLPIEERKSAKGAVTKFLLRQAKNIESSAYKLLDAYLKSTILGG